MYPIAYVIYGVPITEAVSARLNAMEADASSSWSEDADGPCGFITIYSGVAEHQVGYCGVELARHPCVQTPVDLAGLPEPTEAERASAAARIDRLDPGIAALCPPVGRYLVFGTS